MSIDTKACKEAIVKSAATDPQRIQALFVDTVPVEPAKLQKNWVRIYKERQADGTTMRTFDCKPYDDQLRAYVVDDGQNILSVSIEGE
jgi:hypothetical protein